MKGLLPLCFLLQACAGSRPATVNPQAAADAQVPLPESAALFERHIEASGGEDAYILTEPLIARFSVSIPSQGIEGEMVIYQAPPNQMLASQLIQGLGESAEGFDGEVAWAVDAMMGPRVIEGSERERVVRDATADWMLHLDHWLTRMDPVETGSLFGETAYQVTVETRWGSEEIYGFDIETGLQLGMASDIETPMGKIPVVALLMDWREVESGLAPFRIEQRTGPIVVELIMVELDTSPSEFPEIAPPPEIQALLNDTATP